jgi:hypothetical protein
MLDLLIGAGGQAFDAAHARIGVGDSTVPATHTDVDLNAVAGNSHRQFVMMDATYPYRSGTGAFFAATFLSVMANFPWSEWCIDNGTANGVVVAPPVLNHKTASFGTKILGQPWQVQATITIV